MDRPPAGLVQSLLIKAQRRLLDGVGRQVGTPVVYLKAAWADPVLYGGRGERAGGDVDVLVRPAWTFEGRPHWVTVDLHRGIAEPPWFELPADQCVDRAITYDSVDGPILSLCPEDQVLYAATHYGQHRFSIDQKHLDDTERLVRTRAIDWTVVLDRARPLGLEVALLLMLESLRARGAEVPATAEGPALRWRLAFARRWVSTGPELERRFPMTRVVDNAIRMPLLSGRATALPRFIAGYMSLRALDVAVEMASRVTAGIVR
jgi:hypothetical protein